MRFALLAVFVMLAGFLGSLAARVAPLAVERGWQRKMDEVIASHQTDWLRVDGQEADDPLHILDNMEALKKIEDDRWPKLLGAATRRTETPADKASLRDYDDAVRQGATLVPGETARALRYLSGKAKDELTAKNAKARFEERLRNLRQKINPEGIPVWAAFVQLAGKGLLGALPWLIGSIVALLIVFFSPMAARLKTFAVGTDGVKAELAEVERGGIDAGKSKESAEVFKTQLDDAIERYRDVARKLLDEATKDRLSEPLKAFVNEVRQARLFCLEVVNDLTDATANNRQRREIGELYSEFLEKQGPINENVFPQAYKYRATVFLPDLVLKDHLVQARPYALGGGSHDAGRTFSIADGIIGRAWRRRQLQAVASLALERESNGGLIRDYYGKDMTPEVLAKQKHQSLLAVPIQTDGDEKPIGLIFVDHEDQFAVLPNGRPEIEPIQREALKYALDSAISRLKLREQVNAANAALAPFRLEIRTSSRSQAA